MENKERVEPRKPLQHHGLKESDIHLIFIKGKVSQRTEEQTSWDLLVE